MPQSPTSGRPESAPEPSDSTDPAASEAAPNPAAHSEAANGTDFRAALHQAADLVADYLEGVGDRPVLPGVEPGDVGAMLPTAPPAESEPYETLLDDYRRIVEPNVTHWNHPGFLAYFSSSGSEPGILGELLTAGLSVNAMLWHTSPVATELELRVTDWLRQMVGLPEDFSGHINDGASMSTFLALAVARGADEELDVRHLGLAGRPELGRMVLYTSEQSHSSVDKAAIALGLGLQNVRHVGTDDAFSMDPAELAEKIAEDRANGLLPIAVVASLGTTSSTSVDPVGAIAGICQREGLWLHVDAAWAGSAAICPEYRHYFEGWEQADSIVVNPHKWMFTPMDCSVLFVRDPEALKAAFSLVPEYLVTEDHPAKVDLMDFGVQLGRRFRALKLWMVIRSFGVEGLRQRIRQHCELGQALAGWIDGDPGFERLAPVPFSTVCFRALAPGASEASLEALNQRLLQTINSRGPIFLSQTKLHGIYCLRIAVSNLRTTAAHVERAWEIVREEAQRLREGGSELDR